MPSLNLDDLNPAQRDAVLAPDGPTLILAGAGSGKTRVLTYRIAHLMAERNAAPEGILAVTFTNKAANEMRERVASLVGGGARMPWVSTFHSACARILRQEIATLGGRYDRNFTILDESATMAAIRRVLEEAQLADSPPPEVVRARIDQAKNEGQFPRDVAENAADGRERTLAQVYQLYQDRLAAMNALDFGDLILQPIGCCVTMRKRSRGGSGAHITCWLTSTRTPIAFSTCWSGARAVERKSVRGR